MISPLAAFDTIGGWLAEVSKALLRLRSKTVVAYWPPAYRVRDNHFRQSLLSNTRCETCDMELCRLRCFAVLAEELHFTRATDRLHI